MAKTTANRCRKYGYYKCRMVLGNAGTPLADAPEFISWPPKGYAPKQFTYPRWSFSIVSGNFTCTTVSMKDQSGQSILLSFEELDNAYGNPTLVWVPSINVNSLAGDATCEVTLQNVSIDDEMKDFDYEVVLFDIDN